MEIRNTEKKKKRKGGEPQEKIRSMCHTKFGILMTFSGLVGYNWILLRVISKETDGSSKSSAII